MRNIQQLFLATILTGIGYSFAQSAEAISFNIAGGAIADAVDAGGGNSTATATDFTFTVSGITPAQTASVSININLTHPNLQQVEAYLFAPTNQRLNLVAFASGANFVSTNFIDTGVAISTGTAPYNGDFAPDGTDLTEPFDPNSITTFDGFKGFNPNGTWTLRIYDTINGDTGTLGSTTLNIEPVPFEFSPTFGLLAVGGWFGRKKIASKIKAWRSHD